MLCRVVLKVIPEMLGKGVFRVGFRFENTVKLGAVRRKFRELEIPPLAESNEEDTLAVLRDDTLGVNDLVINGVAQCFGERAMNNVKSLSAVVTF